MTWPAEFQTFLTESLTEPNETIYLPKIHNSLKRRVAHLLWRFNVCIGWNHFGKKFNERLKKIPKGDTVIIITYNTEPTMNIVPQLRSGVKKYIWLWDSLKVIGDSDRCVKTLKKLKCPIVTFDPLDAEKYGLHHIPQFYNMQYEYSKRKPIVDLYLLISPKYDYRKSYLQTIRNRIEDLDIITNFVVIDYKKKYPISYKENIENILDCRCILDIVHQGQSGLTLRPLEALVFEKKLITTNVHIKEYDFYNSNNIFIWGEDDESKLEHFIKSPYQKVDKSIIQQYDINVWLKKLQSL